jgi:orotidine-5'-phosphate decarboxylase
MAPANATYSARAAQHKNALAKQLLELMERKKTNLAVSIDVTKSEELLRIADEAGPYICIVKVGS